MNSSEVQEQTVHVHKYICGNIFIPLASNLVFQTSEILHNNLIGFSLHGTWALTF